MSQAEFRGNDTLLFGVFGFEYFSVLQWSLHKVREQANNHYMDYY